MSVAYGKTWHISGANSKPINENEKTKKRIGAKYKLQDSSMEHDVALPKLKLVTSISHPKFLDFIEPPKYPFSAPLWTLQEKPRHISLLDVFKNNELIGTYNVYQQPVYLIGRNTLICDIVLSHCSISRLHATLLHHRDGCTYLVDLGSCHGTYVDEAPLKKLQPTLIVHGSLLKFGASSRSYSFKSFESKEQILERVRDDSADDEAEFIVQKNTMLNKALSYRLGLSPELYEKEHHSPSSTSCSMTLKDQPVKEDNDQYLITDSTLHPDHNKSCIEHTQNQNKMKDSFEGNVRLKTVKHVHFGLNSPDIIPEICISARKRHHSDTNLGTLTECIEN